MEKKIRIYDINSEYLALAEQLIENEGELTAEISEALKINEEQLQAKGRGYSFIIKSITDDVDIIDKEIARLTQLKKVRKNAAERLKLALLTAMEIHGITKIETPTLKVSLRSSESVLVDNVAALDRKFVNRKTTISVDKTAIKAAIKADEEVVGAVLVRNNSIQIK